MRLALDDHLHLTLLTEHLQLVPALLVNVDKDEYGFSAPHPWLAVDLLKLK